jgi:hypothetical protein
VLEIEKLNYYVFERSNRDVIDELNSKLPAYDRKDLRKLIVINIKNTLFKLSNKAAESDKELWELVLLLLMAQKSLEHLFKSESNYDI